MKSKTRLAGILYLINFITGSIALMLADRDFVLLIATLAYVGVIVLFFSIFEPVDARISFAAALVGLLGCAAGVVSMYQLAPMPVNNLAIFGVYCLLIGYLIIRSTFLPRLLGVCLMIGGVSWLTFAWPQLSARLAPYNMAPGILAELALTIWLLARRVDVPRLQTA